MNKCVICKTGYLKKRSNQKTCLGKICVRKNQIRVTSKRKEYNKKWFKDNKKLANEWSKKWHKDNPEKVRESRKKWVKDNPERVLYHKNKWKERNKDKMREYSRTHWRRNCQKFYSKDCARCGEQFTTTHSKIINCKEHRNSTGSQTGKTKQRFMIFMRDNFTCTYCGRKAPKVELHVDHIKPKSKGGTNKESNLTTSCVDCNLGKSDVLLQM